ncbi:xylose isomerase-like protein [Aspergillus ambiguus]|uniref:sugar phosphate isomerase/epimerase family protein n=1 Tax=Aspergillus ambiguus TaxID=176160 RepID=UPI003CCCE8B7
MPNIKVAIASNSLGKSVAGHSILRKLEVARSHGFEGVEVAFECLDAHAASFLGSRSESLRAAAGDVHQKARSLSLRLIALNPFGAYDGLKDPVDIDDRLKEAELWFELCVIMEIPIFQITSCLYPMDEARITSDPKVIARNMRRLGLKAQKYNLLVAYEAPAWGIHIDTWQHIQEILSLVDLPNVGHCLDTFHISAREAGDPFNAGIRSGGLERLKSSLDEMRHIVRPSSIVYLQLSDATKADPEQTSYPRKDFNQPKFMTQSRNCRIPPCEPEGTLPADRVAKAIFDMGYSGWVSIEVFHTDMWSDSAS